MFDLLHLHHLPLFEDLDGIVPLVVFGLDEMDPSKTTRTEGPEDLEILERVLSLRYSYRILARLEYLLLRLLILCRMTLELLLARERLLTRIGLL